MSQVQIELHKLSTINMDRTPISCQQPLQSKIPFDARNVYTNNVYAQGCSITAWQQLYDQLSSGGFQGAVSELWIEGVQIIKESTNRAIHRSCIVWPGSIWFGIPKTKKLNNLLYVYKPTKKRAVDSTDFCTFELITPTDEELFSVVISEEVFSQYFDGYESIFFSPYENMLSVCSVDLVKKNEVLSEIFDLFNRLPSLHQDISNDKIRRQLKEQLLFKLTQLLSCAKEWTVKRQSGRKYQKLIFSSREFVLSKGYQNTNIVQLCDYLHVSRRTLQNAFESEIKINPLKYLKAIRLNAVHRELLSKHSAHEVIQEAASSWGFNHMGQFAADYCQLFNELPSKTLAVRGENLIL